MSKELSKTGMDKSQIELIKSTVAKGATDDELKLFLYTAQRTGLDPLTRQIHFVKRKTSKWNAETRQRDWVDQMTIQTGIDGYRVVAERTKTLAGIDDAIFDDETGVHPNKASVTVYRLVDGTRVAFTASARWSEYAQTYEKEGKVITGPMWAKMPYLMLAKCAEALALRKAFPNDLSGVYTNEEMTQADNPAVEQQVAPSAFINTAKTAPVAPVKPQVVEAVIDMNNPLMEGAQVEQTCQYCGVKHYGKYSKCLNCWKKERAGQKLTELPKTKTLVNENEPPFPS